MNAPVKNPVAAARPPVWKQMASGRMVDLANLKSHDVYFPDIVEALCKIARFDGATPNVVYTVAQHCCLAYDAASEERVKPFALLHDFHEAYIGDITTPTARLLQAMHIHPGEIVGLIGRVKAHLDTAIFAAAGIPPFIDVAAYQDVARQVRAIDDALLATERRDLLAPAQGAGWPEPMQRPLPTRIRPWGQDKGREELLKRLSLIGIDGRG
ncbi:hypothetical protein H2509_13620 [Stappia sp. F7233]|uniref:HD domain-containing protein n=1 Tax=Stappia albiluteola TaxID=2758565 RepID=A0A839AEP6_9HYPH|nr:hypothetical protein [Stappia albiluteola]MBA5778163.1 hypothetical protein [Stappia albiluteola]